MAGRRPEGRAVAIYDDDHYYMGGVLAELLVREGFSVTLVTPAAEASVWTHMTMEQPRIQARLLELGIRILAHHGIAAIGRDAVEATCVFTDRRTAIEAATAVLVTARNPENGLGAALHARRDAWDAAGIRSVTVLGDALAPGTIAAAVFSGRRYAEELDQPRDPDAMPFRREVAALSTETLPWG
jgi:dimethylamine/trimethylamine dehydrogenase